MRWGLRGEGDVVSWGTGCVRVLSGGRSEVRRMTIVGWIQYRFEWVVQRMNDRRSKMSL